jgi:hypothetical protein
MTKQTMIAPRFRSGIRYPSMSMVARTLPKKQSDCMRIRLLQELQKANEGKEKRDGITGINQQRDFSFWREKLVMIFEHTHRALLLQGKAKHTEIPRSMEVPVAQGSPGGPVRMGGPVAALIQIAPPLLPFHPSDTPCIALQQGEGDTELQRPCDFILYLRLNNGRKTAIDRHLPALLQGKRCSLRHSPIDPGRVCHVGSEQGTAAVELEIEVALVRHGLYKELDTAVLIYRGLKTGMDTPHISFLDKEKSVEVTVIVEHFALYKRPIRGAFGSEATDTEKGGFTPRRSVPEPVQLRTNVSFGNGMTVVTHMKGIYQI